MREIIKLNISRSVTFIVLNKMLYVMKKLKITMAHVVKLLYYDTWRITRDQAPDLTYFKGVSH
jgi:hypothetical protein